MAVSTLTLRLSLTFTIASFLVQPRKFNTIVPHRPFCMWLMCGWFGCLLQTLHIANLDYKNNLPALPPNQDFGNMLSSKVSGVFFFMLPLFLSAFNLVLISSCRGCTSSLSLERILKCCSLHSSYKWTGFSCLFCSLFPLALAPAFKCLNFQTLFVFSLCFC